MKKNPFIVMYHGGIISGRGIETLLSVTQKNEHIVTIILGNGDESYIETLKREALSLGVKDRVLFHAAVPHNILWQYVGAADVGVTLAKNNCLNHYYMLPNKLFENIQSLIPIIGSDFPEIRKIIVGYNIGICVDPESIDDIVEAIEIMRNDKDLYKLFKNNLQIAKKELCWENEKKILQNQYVTVLSLKKNS